MDEHSLLVRDLVGWARENGTSLDPRIEIYHDPITRLSFRALQDIEPGTKLVSCSFQTTFSYLNAIGTSSSFQSHSPPFPNSFMDTLKVDDPNIIGHFFLIQQYLLGPESFWWSYVRLLPQPDVPESVGIPALWPDADLAFLEGTNAEPPVKERKRLWKEEWHKGLNLLGGGIRDNERYTYHLYRWAASIFGSRSFRASLTIPPELIADSERSPEEESLNMTHMRQDRFSVLLPVLDIGNHNGINQVNWSRDPAARLFTLSNRELITQGNQIYNFYGDKSNSELLVAYGFTLPDLERDTVNLKLTPNPEAVLLRRSYILDQDFMFNVRISNDVSRPENAIPELKAFSPGLVDTLSCMVANTEERRLLLVNCAYSPEKDPGVLSGPMSRNIVFALCLLREKLQWELSRIEKFDDESREPKNQNQRVALDYRNRQKRVLQTAIPPISSLLRSAFSYSSLCQHPPHSANNTLYTHHPMHCSVEFISLECAFDWLHINYPNESSRVCELISEDQDEPLPLDWAVLVEGWDHTYWTVWIFLVWMIWLQDQSDFEKRHPSLATWISVMNVSYEDALLSDPAMSRLHAEPEEEETIDLMVTGITNFLYPVSSAIVHPLLPESLRDFASFVATEQVLSAPYQMINGSRAGETVKQKLLWFAASGRPTSMREGASWTTFLSSLPARSPQ